MTIGFLVDWTVSPYHYAVYEGIRNQTEKQNINLICFENGKKATLEHRPVISEITSSILSEQRINGLIVLSGALDHGAKDKEPEELFRKIKTIPVVVIAGELGNAHSILINNRIGMENLMIHLLEDHKFKNFAFISGTKGNYDAEERFAAFLDMLKEYDLSIDEKYIFPGDFGLNSGIEAVRKFYKDKNTGLDVIVAANDAMAIGATRELTLKGIKVPEDVSIVGFDNVIFSRYSIPPLTTVAQPLYQQGIKAVEILYDLIKGKKVSRQTLMTPQLVIRESCSCFANRSTFIKEEGAQSGNEFHTLFNSKKKYLITSITHTLADLFSNHALPEPASLLETLLDQFCDGINHRSTTAFLQTLLGLAANPVLKGGEIFSLHALISEIRFTVFPFISDRESLAFAEDLCNKAIKLIGFIALQVENFDHNEFILQNQVLGTLHEELITVKGLDALFLSFRKRLAEMEIHSCYISVFCGKGKDFYENARLVFVYNKENHKTEIDREIIYPSEEIIPKPYFTMKQGQAIIIKYLKQVGFIIFELKKNDDMKIYSPLCDLIGNALNSTLYFTEVQTQKESLDKNLANLRKAMSGFIETMALTIEMRDPYTAGHQRRVSDLARQIATCMGLSEVEIESVRMAGIVHDLGKIYVPSEILNKPGGLQDIEFNLIKTHPKVAYDILKNIEFPWPIAEIVFQHHEHLDGSGYPRGLKGKMIRIEARILAVADVVEAMASHRPYRPALGIDKACEEIARCKGKLYDPDIVDCCIKLFKEQGYQFK